MQGFEKMLKMVGFDPTEMKEKATAFFNDVRQRFESVESKLDQEIARLEARVIELECQLVNPEIEREYQRASEPVHNEDQGGIAL